MTAATGIAGRHRRHANPFSLREIGPPDWPAGFGEGRPWALDVGCGGGAFTVELARRLPQLWVLGVELRAHLVAEVRARMDEARCGNGWALVANASCHLGALVPARRLVQVTVNFPDPWYKTRHHKRRVVGGGWLAALAPLLATGALLHVMTDYLPLAETMAQALAEAAGWTPAFGCRGWVPASTTGITSEREVLHTARREPVWRLCYRYLPRASVAFDLPAARRAR